MNIKSLFKKLHKNIYIPIKQFGVIYGLKIISYRISNLLQMRIHRYGYLGNKNIKTAMRVLKSRKWSRLPYPSPLSLIFTKQFLSPRLKEVGKRRLKLNNCVGLSLLMT